MFDIGFWEILVIGVVALLVIGPEKLPDVARTVGRWVAKVQRFVAGVKADINSELESGELRKILGDQESQIRELKDMVNDAKRGFESEANNATSIAEKNLNALKNTVEEPNQGDLPVSTTSSETSDTKNEQLN